MLSCHRSFWTTFDNPYSDVNVEFLMPNAQYLSLPCKASTKLVELRAKLWLVASQYVLFHVLEDQSCHIFIYVDSSGIKQEVIPDHRLLSDVPFFVPLFDVRKQVSNDCEAQIDHQIRRLIGRRIDEFEDNSQAEIMSFRAEYRLFCEAISNERAMMCWEQKVLYQYPAEIDLSWKLPAYLAKTLQANPTFYVTFHHGSSSTSKIACNNHITPQSVLKLGLKRYKSVNSEEYVLKVVGQDLYLLGHYDRTNRGMVEFPIVHYKYVRDRLSLGVEPHFCAVKRSQVRISMDTAREVPPPIPKKQSRQVNISILAVTRHFYMHISMASNVNYPDMKFFVQAAIYVGSEQLAGICRTNLVDGPDPTFNYKMEFKIWVACLPRLSRLCITLSAVPSSKAKRVAKDCSLITNIGWVNLHMFDHQGVLLRGSKDLILWPLDKSSGSTDAIDPRRTVIPMPRSETAPVVHVIFSESDTSLVYPCKDDLLSYAPKSLAANDIPVEDLVKLEALINQDPVQFLSVPCDEKDRDLLWSSRHWCQRQCLRALPKILLSIRWDDVAQQAMRIQLLDSWPLLPPESALELLDFTYSDPWIRSYAVRCLEQLHDSELECFLLQLVQALKYETYFDCELARFLLRRALLNRRLGHYLFWHLRSEVSSLEYALRFALMIEAYCRGALGHLPALWRQVNMINSLKSIAEIVLTSSESIEECIKLTRDFLTSNFPKSAVLDVESPLDPRFTLKAISPNKCKVMDSKKRPLFLTFENIDPLGDSILIIFKCGDDLRQDMLTLQTLRIMGNIWQKSGEDLMLTPYGCLATEKNTGLIEVVTEASTLAEIQRVHGYKKEVLYEWLSEKIVENPRQKIIQRCAEMFRLSCCGYSVATYVLGIGDRHNGNVMLRTNGQLFHIDFGHFLGNFKYKFGIKRERVPFILTKDFVYIACCCHPDLNDEIDPAGLERFQKMCVQSFRVLRDHGHLLVVLFMLMLNSGLPELRRMEDISYLRTTLGLERDKDSALKSFLESFTEAYNRGWMTTINFVCHNIKHA